MFKHRNHSDLRERAGVAAPSLPPSQEEGRSSGDPRCIARSVEALFLGEPAAARVSEGGIWKCTCAGGGLSAGASSRDRSNEAKGVASEAFAVERLLAHTLDFFVACHEKTRSHVPVLRTGACGDPCGGGGRPAGLPLCVCARLLAHPRSSYLVDPASSHMLVSKIKPCMSKYKHLYTVRLRTAH
jgi:hypothetical protein